MSGEVKENKMGVMPVNKLFVVNGSSNDDFYVSTSYVTTL